MTTDHEALAALRAADRPRPLPEDARRRVEERMLLAHEQTLTEKRQRPADARPAVVVELGAAASAREDRRRVRPLLALVAATVLLIVAVGTAVALRAGPDDRVDVAGFDDAAMDPEVVRAVRTWCRSDLTALRRALDPPIAALDDDQRRVALGTLAATADGLFEVLTDLQRPDGARRLREVGRISGEAALLRDSAGAVDTSDVDALLGRLDAELVLLSAGGASCELPA